MFGKHLEHYLWQQKIGKADKEFKQFLYYSTFSQLITKILSKTEH